MRGVLPLVVGFVIGLLILTLLSEIYNETTTYFLLDFAVLFSILPFYYIRNTPKMFLFLIVIIAEFFYATFLYGTILYPFLQMFAIGTACGAVYRSGLEVLEREHRENRKIETQRDLVHILIGIIVLALFVFLNFYTTVYVLTTLILIGYIYNSALGNRKPGKLSGILKSLERENVLYGLGAVYLGVGAALLVGFIHNLHFVIIGVAALFFADPIATIVGVNLNGPKLFYNKKKSLFGTLAFFAVVSLIGYPFIGYYSLLFGLGLAIIESMKFPIDDNIMIAIVMIVLYVLFLSLVHQLPSPLQVL